MKPLVSVVMPVYNGELYLSETIKSILGQSLEDLELIIVNDASSDNSKAIIDSFDDPRIIYHEYSTNMGMACARNKGIELARAAIVAMTDQDDVSHKNRLEEQVRYLGENESCMLVGTWARHFGESKGVYRYCTENSQIKIRMLGNSQFSHPSIAFRRCLVTEAGQLYDQNFAPADDYRMLSQVTATHEVHNLPMELLLYRTHGGQVSTRKADVLTAKADLIRLDYIEKIFGIRLSQDEKKQHLDAIFPKPIKQKKQIFEHTDWFKNLVGLAPANFDKRSLEIYFSERLIGTLCQSIETYGLRGLYIAFLLPIHSRGRTRDVWVVLKALIRSRIAKSRLLFCQIILL